MKKQVIFVGMLFVIGFMMSSCEKTTYVNNIEWKIYDCNANINNWQYSFDTDIYPSQYNNNCYFSKFEIPALTSFVFNDGNVQCYMMDPYATGSETQCALPFTKHIEVIENGVPTGHYYTETYSCVYGIGWVEFDYVASDFAYEDEYGRKPDYKPQPCTFRVVLQW